jgi:hypothetical protein
MVPDAHDPCSSAVTTPSGSPRAIDLKLGEQRGRACELPVGAIIEVVAVLESLISGLDPDEYRRGVALNA